MPSSTKFAGSVVSTGTGDAAWSNPSNATAEDGTEASVALAPAETSENLRATDFGFAIPSDADIVGIEAHVKRRQENSARADFRDQLLRLRDSTGQVGDDKADTATTWPTTLTTRNYGGSADTWAAALDAADVNASSFGADLQVTQHGTVDTRSGFVDALWITVHYEESGVDATVEHGLILGHDVSVDLGITADAEHGLILGHSISFRRPSAAPPVIISQQTGFTVRIYPPLTSATERHPPLHAITFDGLDTTFEIKTELPGGFAGARVGGMIRRGDEILPAYLPRPASQLRPFAHVEISAGANVIWEGRADTPENDAQGEPVGFTAKGYWSAFTDNFYEGDSPVDLSTGNLLRDMVGQVAPMLTVGDGVQFEDPGNLHSPEEYHRRKGSALVDAINKQGDTDGNPVDVAVWGNRTVWLTSRVAPDRPRYLIQPGTPGVQIDEAEWSELWGEVWIEHTTPGGVDTIAGPFTDRTFEDRFGFLRRTVLNGGTLTAAAAERVARTYLAAHATRQYAISVDLENGAGLTRLDGGIDAPWNVRAGSWARVPGYGDYVLIDTSYQSTDQTLRLTLNQQRPSWNRLLSRLQVNTKMLAAGINPNSGGRNS